MSNNIAIEILGLTPEVKPEPQAVKSQAVKSLPTGDTVIPWELNKLDPIKQTFRRLFSSKAILVHDGYDWYTTKQFPLENVAIHKFVDTVCWSMGIDRYIGRAVEFAISNQNRPTRDILLKLGLGFCSGYVKKYLESINDPQTQIRYVAEQLMLIENLLLVENHLHNKANSNGPYNQLCQRCVSHKHIPSMRPITKQLLTAQALAHELVQLDSQHKWKHVTEWLVPAIEELCNVEPWDIDYDFFQKVRAIRKKLM